jgi:hypothetical protein
VDFWLDIFPRLAKAFGFACGCGGGEDGLEKPRLLNASLMPPKEDCCGEI